MIDTDKYEKAYEEWMLMEEPMGSFQAFLFVEYQKALAEVKRLREEIERIAGITNGYVGPTKAWAEHITKDLLAVIE